MKDGSKAIINHAFGTSSADDLLYYYYRMVRPYKPRALVLATGGNDVGFGYTAKEVMEIEARIIDWAQADFPGIKIYCFSTDPNVKHKGEKTRGTRFRDEYDELLEDYCRRRENCVYVSLVDQPFYFENPEDVGDYDKVRDDIFVNDGVHLNPKGYAMFMDFLRELFDDML
jgi:lysophospholipase L1-like esterase